MASQRSLPSSHSMKIPLRHVDQFHIENDFGIPQTPPMSDFLSSRIAGQKLVASDPPNPQTTVNITHSSVSISRFGVRDAMFDRLKTSAIEEIPAVVKTVQTHPDQTTLTSSTAEMPTTEIPDKHATDIPDNSRVVAPHDYERNGPSPNSLLEIYENATIRTRRRHASEEGKTLVNPEISDLQNPKCQSLPPTPQISPKFYRKRVGSLDTELGKMKNQELVRREGSILSRVSAMFHPPTLQERSEVEIDFENKPENLVTNDTNTNTSFLNWGTQSKVAMSKRDFNMLAPTST